MQYQDRSCARQKLVQSDTERRVGRYELEWLVWQLVALEQKLTQKVTSDAGAGLSFPRSVAEKNLRVVCLHRNSRSHRRLSGLRRAGIARKSSEHHNNECRDFERTLMGKAQSECRAREDRGAGRCAYGTQERSRWRFDMRTHLAGKRNNTTGTE